MVNNNLAFRNAVSVFYRFSMQYCGFCRFFSRYCGFGYPPMSPSTSRNHSLNSATRSSKMAVRIILVSSSVVYPTSAACVCKWASNCVQPKNLKIFPEESCEKSCESLCGLRQKITLQILQESVRIINVFSTALHPRYAPFVLRVSCLEFPRNSQKITKQLLKPRSVFACTDDIR